MNIKLRNVSQENAQRHWADGEYNYREVMRQEYSENNCIFSTGIIDDHPHDTIYLRWEKDGEEPMWLQLRQDEVTSLIWLLSGALWSEQMEHLIGALPEEPAP